MFATKRARSRSGIQKRCVCQGLRRFFSDNVAPSRDRRWRQPVTGPIRRPRVAGSSVGDPPAACYSTTSPGALPHSHRVFWERPHPTAFSARTSDRFLRGQTSAGYGQSVAPRHPSARRCSGPDSIPRDGRRQPTGAPAPNGLGERRLPLRTRLSRSPRVASSKTTSTFLFGCGILASPYPKPL